MALAYLFPMPFPPKKLHFVRFMAGDHSGEFGMTKRLKEFLLSIVILVAATLACGAVPQGTMAFTVSMDEPHTHYFHIIFRCEGVKGELSGR
jgi:hypothetical protein